MNHGHVRVHGIVSGIEEKGWSANRREKKEKKKREKIRDIPPDCEIGDNCVHHLASPAHNDHPLCDSVWMKSMCSLQVMVSENPRGEPLLQANDE